MTSIGHRSFGPNYALAEFCNSLGQFYQKRENNLAIKYYQLAVDIGGNRPDPLAVLNLSDLYAAQQNYASLDQLVKTVVPTLFESKSDAYKRSDYKRIFMYHHTLGLIFSHIESKAGASSVGIASAEFQLDHALSTARKYNEGNHTDSIVVQPENH